MRLLFSPTVEDFEGICELGYLKKISENIKEYDDEHCIVVGRISDIKDEIILENFISNIEGKKHLIFISDEKGIFPNIFNKVNTVFRTYNRKGLFDNKKIFPIPCGYSSGHRNGFYGGENKKKLLLDREYDIFYSGQKSINRHNLEIILPFLNSNYKCRFSINNGFSAGYGIMEYYNFLQNSKISLVPNGVVIPESFRFFESFESNCAVITTYPFKNENYNHWYYEDCPAILVEDWSLLTNKLIDNILENLNEIQYKNLNYYNSKLSPRAVSDFILNNLKK